MGGMGKDWGGGRFLVKGSERTWELGYQQRLIQVVYTPKKRLSSSYAQVLQFSV